MNKKILWSLLLTSTFPCSQLQAQHKQKPNIIYILADDLGRAELGAYGQQLIETPHLDRLAQEGMTFSNHYSGQAVSAPSRCVLFTGLHTGHAYIRGNDEMGFRGNVGSHEAMFNDSTLEGQRPVPANTIMIPRVLKKANYRSACIGKWGLGYPGSEGTPIKMGFDFFYGYNCQRQAHTYYPPFLYRNEKREYLKNTLFPVPHQGVPQDFDAYNEGSYTKYTKKQYAPDLLYKEMIQFIDSNKNAPFVLFWTTPVPHVPLQAPKKWVDYYHKKFGDEEPYVGKSYYPCRYPRATYAAMVSYWDAQIGDLVQYLKKEGLYENTIIIFTSDNGPSFAGGTKSTFFDSAKPFKSERGWAKCYLHEGGIRTPMIAVWKNHIQPGSTTDVLSAFWDMMPTMCDIAGVETPKTDGISLLPTLLGQNQKGHNFLYWEFPELDGERALRFGKWKAFVKNIKRGNHEIELFNLELDPREQTDVAKYNPDIIEKVKKIFKQEHTDSSVKRFQMNLKD